MTYRCRLVPCRGGIQPMLHRCDSHPCLIQLGLASTHQSRWPNPPSLLQPVSAEGKNTPPCVSRWEAQCGIAAAPSALSPVVLTSPGRDRVAGNAAKNTPAAESRITPKALRPTRVKAGWQRHQAASMTTVSLSLEPAGEGHPLTVSFPAPALSRRSCTACSASSCVRPGCLLGLGHASRGHSPPCCRVGPERPAPVLRSFLPVPCVQDDSEQLR